MSFTYPMGLLGLIGIPVLIILYIIKSHYAEQTVASVYLWQLSERFLKKKKRLRFGGLLCLLLEILAVAAISLTVAGPVFTLPDAAQDYCFVLDASGSMTATVPGADGDAASRFEVGKTRIRDIIREAKDGSTYSLIVAGESTYEAYEALDDRDTALALLDQLSCSWSTGSYADALSVAQGYCTADHSPVVYLVTDRDCETENIQLINVSDSTENYALASYTWSRVANEGALPTLVASGEVISYDRDADITVELYVDDALQGSTTVSAVAGEPTAFELNAAAGTESFSDIRLVITNTDSQPADNVGVLYSRGETENNKTLLVSDAPAYLEFMLRASGKTAVDTVTTGKYSQNKENYTGYGLYIFDSFTDPDKLPEELPQNATIWFFDLQKSIPGTGFGFREQVVAEGTIGGSGDSSSEGETGAELENRFEPTYTTSTASFARKLLSGVREQTVSVKKYARYVPNRTFTTLLYQESDSLIFVGNNENGDRQVVFAFDLHDSDLPLGTDFLILMDNLLEYSFPTVLEQTLYTVGDEMTVNVPAGCTDLLLQAPSGKISYPDFSESVSTGSLTEAGTYTLTATVGGVDQTYRLFVRMPEGESYGVPQEGTLSIERQSDSTVTDGFYDKLIVYFIILAIAFVLDWGVYCYEQYQLR